LISVSQRIGGYAEDLLNLLINEWSDVQKPTVFVRPEDPQKLDKWEKCLASCEDYFGRQSREYRLLEQGIVVHHGKMPGLMARLLVQLVEDGVIHLILATSTLSEGVNLPFEVVLIPSLRRGQGWISEREFTNLAGRAGRPGHGTEGRCLVVLPAPAKNWSERQITAKYEELIAKTEISPSIVERSARGHSALAELIRSLHAQWQLVTNSANVAEFLKWLEITAPLRFGYTPASSTEVQLNEMLDSLDSVLLAAIVELESLVGVPLNATELERRLSDIWRHCYAHYASANEANFGKWFVHRGSALAARVYPDVHERRRLYRSGLPPIQGKFLLSLYPSIKEHLLSGFDYAGLSSQERFDFLVTLVSLLGKHPRFKPLAETLGNADWRDILRWWLDPNGAEVLPSAKKVSDWYDYVASNFGYRFAWGIGCILALAADEASRSALVSTTLENWPETGLPWVALWLKELVVWGTLDPIVAYLLGHGRAWTRKDGEQLSRDYVKLHRDSSANEILDPSLIRKWAARLYEDPKGDVEEGRRPPLPVKLERLFPEEQPRRWRGLPALFKSRIQWVDPAGFVMATGNVPRDWNPSWLFERDFFLDVDSRQVFSQPYL